LYNFYTDHAISKLNSCIMKEGKWKGTDNSLPTTRVKIMGLFMLSLASRQWKKNMWFSSKKITPNKKAAELLNKIMYILYQRDTTTTSLKQQWKNRTFFNVAFLGDETLESHVAFCNWCPKAFCLTNQLTR